MHIMESTGQETLCGTIGYPRAFIRGKSIEQRILYFLDKAHRRHFDEYDNRHKKDCPECMLVTLRDFVELANAMRGTQESETA